FHYRLDDLGDIRLIILRIERRRTGGPLVGFHDGLPDSAIGLPGKEALEVVGEFYFGHGDSGFLYRQGMPCLYHDFTLYIFALARLYSSALLDSSSSSIRYTMLSIRISEVRDSFTRSASLSSSTVS